MVAASCYHLVRRLLHLAHRQFKAIYDLCHNVERSAKLFVGGSSYTRPNYMRASRTAISRTPSWQRYILLFSLATAALCTLLSGYVGLYLLPSYVTEDTARWPPDTFQALYHRLIHEIRLLVGASFLLATLITLGIVRRRHPVLVLVVAYLLMGISSWLMVNLMMLRSFP